MIIDGKKEAALYVACGLYRTAYDRLCITGHAIKDAPGSLESRKLRSEALAYLREKKAELRKVLDDSEEPEPERA